METHAAALRRWTRFATTLFVGLITLSACAAPQSQPSSAPASGATNAPEARAPKVLTLGILREPKTLVGVIGSLPRTGGAHNPRFIAHNLLVAPDEHGAYQPQLASAKPSVEAGTWQVNPDGSMDTTWKLRPNVLWHDGTPFTASDLVFSFDAKKDPIACCPAGRPELMQSASAPDPLTFVIHWSQVNADADQAQEIEPWPRHILEPLFLGDKEGFVNSPWFTSAFVGLGPYRLVRWDQGSLMELARFDGYFRGRPPLDTVIVRFLDDPNALVAGILSGAVDAVLSPALSVDTALEVRQRWEGTGNEVRFSPGDNFENIQIQYRPDYARPTNGLAVKQVRQAFFQAIDRQTLVDVVSHGVSPVADSW
ncbi:MAG: peptide/nickel transport system substrate-binding protein, partial [Chloroflexota bacterium]|nr:peptide/nickel transport system substrate-binding protein [Chloroflexota bacterium]